jgi:hypothetical protein
MRILLSLAVVGALWAQMPAPPPSKPGANPALNSADPVVLTVGTTKITKSEFETLLRDLPDTIRGQVGGDTVDARRHFAEQFADVIVFAKEARRLKLDSGIAYQFQEESLLAGLLYKHLLETKPTEGVLKKWFEAHKDDYLQAKARQIVIRCQGSLVPVKQGQQDLTEEAALAKAKSLRERIVKGEDFAALAKAESDDPATIAKGGDLGTISHGQLQPELDRAVFTLPAGAVSQPIRTEFGWHLIQLQDRRTADFTEVKAEAEKRFRAESAQNAMQAFRRSTKPVFDEGYFTSTPPSNQSRPAAQSGHAAK